MIIGLLTIVLYIDESNSLKQKRMVINSLTKRLRNCFNVSIDQIDHQDKWQKSSLAIVSVGKDQRLVNSALSDICNYISHDKRASILNYEIQML